MNKKLKKFEDGNIGGNRCTFSIKYCFSLIYEQIVQNYINFIMKKYIDFKSLRAEKGKTPGT